MKIALAQMNVIAGMPDKNVDKMLKMIDEAKENKADLIVFPEMCVGGYLVGDKWEDEEFCEDLMQKNKTILKASEGIIVAYGNIFVDKKINQRLESSEIHPNRDGRVRKYNAVYVVQNGKFVPRAKETNILPEGVQPKTLLPTYRIFDDQRYFFSLENVASDFNIPLSILYQPFVVDINDKKIHLGFELCEDLWCEDYKKNKKALNPTKMLIENGANLVFNLSASPWTYGKNKARDRRVNFLKQESGENFVPFFYVNCIGAQNNGKNIVTFDGGTTVYNIEGLPVRFASKSYSEELLLIDTFDIGKSHERIEKPMIEQKYNAIMRGLEHLQETLFSHQQLKFVIGMSGGIDSAVVASLVTKVFGKENIFGINMPTKYNSQQTKDSAAYTANKLGIAYGVIPIEDLTVLNAGLLQKAMKDQKAELPSIHLENIQAKIRGTSILSNFAAINNALFTNNGNKLEVALGYATLYGDVGGAICPIADLTKTEIVELAKFLNKEIFHEEVIPNSLFPDKLWRFSEGDIAPSAELKTNQIDPMKFGYHCALLNMVTDYSRAGAERIMQMYLQGSLHEEVEKYLVNLNYPTGIGYEIMKRWNVDNPREFIKDLKWFIKTIQINVFKRVQAPPIIITSKTAFGYDLRESLLPYNITEKEKNLSEQILNMNCYVPRS